jgi:hypothetical protein
MVLPEQSTKIKSFSVDPVFVTIATLQLVKQVPAI